MSKFQVTKFDAKKNIINFMVVKYMYIKKQVIIKARKKIPSHNPLFFLVALNYKNTLFDLNSVTF